MRKNAKVTCEGSLMRNFKAAQVKKSAHAKYLLLISLIQTWLMRTKKNTQAKDQVPSLGNEVN